MNFPLFIARRITLKSERSFSRLIVRIAIIGIALGLAAMIAALAVVSGFKTAIREKITGFGGSIQVSHLDVDKSYEKEAIAADVPFLKSLNAAAGFSYVQPIALKTGILAANRELEGIVLKGVGPNYAWKYLSECLISGRLPQYSDTAVSSEVLISEHTANILQLKAGDKLLMYFVENPLRKRKFTITGIYSTGVQDVDKLYIIGDINQVRKLNNWTTEQVGAFEIGIADFEQMALLAASVNDGLPEDLQAQSAAELYPDIFEWLSLLDVNGEVIVVLMLLVAGINMVSALLIMILERSNMIGLLKALGSTNTSIRSIFLYNAAYLIGIGMLIGNIAGIGLCWLQQHFHIIALDQQSYYMAYAPIQLDAMPILLLNIGTLTCCLLMLLIPSLLVSRISPIKAIRFN